MSGRVSRRGVFGSLLAVFLAPLAARLRAAMAGQPEQGALAPAAADNAGCAGDSFRYDDCEQMLDESLSGTIYTYDSYGRLICITEANGYESSTVRYGG